MAFNLSKFEAALLEAIGDESWEELSYVLDGKDSKVEVPGYGTVTLVESVGGYEGAGETYYIVFALTDTEGKRRFFKRNGWYASYDGRDLDGPTVAVQAVRKTITVYEEAK